MVNISEKTITVRISEDLHKAIKIKIAQEGVSLKDYVVSLIQKDLEKSK
ncbi:toxin-antitoxin system HicB family antitoxin [Exiguobacterium sp. s192]